jgi:hypothetical protein
MQKFATVAALAFALTGCGVHAAPTASALVARTAAAAHKTVTPDNEPLTAKEVAAAKALVEKALNHRAPDNSVTVSDEKFERTAAVGFLQFTAKRTSVGFAGIPQTETITGTVNTTTGKVTVTGAQG